MGAEEENKPAEEGKAAEEKNKGSAFTKKMVRIVTVMAYLSGISGAGFLLSLYYIIFWDPNIQGVRPPGYFKSGERVGQPQALIDPMPQALTTIQPMVYQRKMSKEFMQEYFNNLSANKGETRMEAADSLMESDPTPRVLPLQENNNNHYYQHNAHQPYNGQTTATQSISNNNHQSSLGPSSHQGITRDTSPTGSPYGSDELRQQQQQQQQQQHGQPQLSASA